MWLKQFFMDETVTFNQKCKRRVKSSIFVAVLGIVSFFLPSIVGQIEGVSLDPGFGAHMADFYRGAGAGLMAAAIAIAIKNIRYLKNPEQYRKLDIAENDERNRLLGLRCWAYAGYSMFLLLYIGMLFAGFISITVLKVLLVVGAVYGILLISFLLLLRKIM